MLQKEFCDRLVDRGLARFRSESDSTNASEQYEDVQNSNIAKIRKVIQRRVMQRRNRISGSVCWPWKITSPSRYPISCFFCRQLAPPYFSSLLRFVVAWSTRSRSHLLLPIMSATMLYLRSLRMVTLAEISDLKGHAAGCSTSVSSFFGWPRIYDSFEEFRKVELEGALDEHLLHSTKKKRHAQVL